MQLLQCIFIIILPLSSLNSAHADAKGIMQLIRQVTIATMLVTCMTGSQWAKR